jgi:hypothetical protein
MVGPASYEAEFPLTNSLLVDSTRVTVEVVDATVDCVSQDYGINAPGACPAQSYPLFDRPPLMAKLVINGPSAAPWSSAATVWVINNHWKSKAGDESANARLRVAQAGAVAERVQTLLSVDPNAQLVVLGDLNDFYEGAAVFTLQNETGLLHPYQWLPALQRYTYIFNGAAQVLDHVLLTPNLVPQVALVEILHIHADAAAGDSPLAHSDHDPVVLRLRPGGAATIRGTLGWGQIQVSASDRNGVVLAQTSSDANGEYRLWGLPPGTLTLQFDAPAWIMLAETTKTVEAAVGMNTTSMAQPRHTTAMTGAWVALNTPWLADALIP